MRAFDNWKPYAGGAEGSGRGAKDWLENKSNNAGVEIGVFKYPKLYDDNNVTGEYWAENVATKIADIIGIECAKTEIGMYYGKIGVMSYLVRNYETESLVEGVSYIADKYPFYDPDSLIDRESNFIYSIQMIDSCIKDTGLFNDFLKIPIFDCLIGNSDRHQSNWAIITDKSNKPLKIAPIYDNGSSLCCRIKDNKAEILLKDNMAFNALIDTKSKSAIGWMDVRRPRHFEMIQYLRESYYHETINFVKNIARNLTNEIIKKIINEFDDKTIEKNIKNLLISFLKERRNKILSVYGLKGGNNMNVLLVVWKDLNTRNRFIVGELIKNDQYIFRYKNIDQARKFGFNGIIGFSNFEKEYTSERLFPIFATRLPDSKRRDIDIILEKYNLEKYDAFELLKACGGRTPIDTYEFIEPISLVTLENTNEILRQFFVAGIRHCELCSDKINEKCTIKHPLKIGDDLELRPEKNNEYDKYAVAIYKNNDKVGFVPRFFSKPVSLALDSGYTLKCRVDFFDDKACCQECTKVSLLITN